jgi:hypothetical protein
LSETFLCSCCPKHFCAAVVRNISVQLLHETFLWSYCPKHFCADVARNISVQMMYETFLYRCCLKHLCTAVFWNIYVQLFPETFMYSCFPKHFCTAVVWNISLQRVPETFLYSCCLKHFCTAVAWNISVQLLFETFLIVRTIWARHDKKLYCSSCKVLLLLSDFKETWFFRQIFEKYSNIYFHEHPSSESWVFRAEGRIDRQTDRRMDGRTEMAKLKVAFRNFANVPNKVRAREATDDNTVRRMRVACRITKATNAIVNTYCFSGATVVTRTRLVIPLYANCLSCLK